MSESEKPAPKAQPENQPTAMLYAVSAHVLKAAIDLIDEEINGKKGRQITNMLERSPMLTAEAISAQNATAK